MKKSLILRAGCDLGGKFVGTPFITIEYFRLNNSVAIYLKTKTEDVANIFLWFLTEIEIFRRQFESLESPSRFVGQPVAADVWCYWLTKTAGYINFMKIDAMGGMESFLIEKEHAQKLFDAIDECVKVYENE